MPETTVDHRIFDVVPGPKESWGIIYRGRAMTLHDNKDEAVKLAKVLAMQNRPSRLVIRASDGEIESETPFEVEGCVRGPVESVGEETDITEEEKENDSPGEEVI